MRPASYAQDVTQQTWADLRPDLGMIGALDEADARISRAEAVLGDRNPRQKWSNGFADACARMIARSVRAEFRLQEAARPAR